jgi:hypothetical protein
MFLIKTKLTGSPKEVYGSMMMMKGYEFIATTELLAWQCHDYLMDLHVSPSTQTLLRRRRHVPRVAWHYVTGSEKSDVW